MRRLIVAAALSALAGSLLAGGSAQAQQACRYDRGSHRNICGPQGSAGTPATQAGQGSYYAALRNRAGPGPVAARPAAVVPVPAQAPKGAWPAAHNHPCVRNALTGVNSCH